MTICGILICERRDYMAKKETDYKRKFNEDNYDRIYVTAIKGKKEEYKALAERNGMSLNAYIVQLLDEQFAKQKPPTVNL